MRLVPGARACLTLSLCAMLGAGAAARAMEPRAGPASHETPAAKPLFGADEEERSVLRQWHADRGELELKADEQVGKPHGERGDEPTDDPEDPADPPPREPRHIHPQTRQLQARGHPATGFLRRATAISIAWVAQPLTFDRHDWQTAGVFVAIPLTLIVSGADDAIYKMITSDRTPAKGKFADFGDQLGGIPVATGIFAGFGLYGTLCDDPRGVHVLEAGVISTALAGALTTSIKLVTGRSRPITGDGSRRFAPFSGELSFPSGHTTVAFSVAEVINYHYPGWLGRSALLLACSTGYARVYNYHHWASDVVFASMLSTATAYCVSGLNLAASHGDLTIEPVVETYGGLAVRRRF